MAAPRSNAVLVVTGLLREAAVAAGPTLVTVAGGADRDALDRRLAALDVARLSAVVSFGLAGALDPALRVGDVVCPDLVLALVLGHDRDGAGCEPDRPTRERQRSALGAAGLRVGSGRLLGVDAAVLGAEAKLALHASRQAVAVDMESHVAARFAAAHGLPFTALRVISDTTRRDQPAVASRAMRPDGSVDVLGVLSGLAREPGQLPALLATARDAAVAFRVLRRVRGLLGPGFGFDL